MESNYKLVSISKYIILWIFIHVGFDLLIIILELIMKWKQMSRFGMKLALGQIKGSKKLIGLDIGSLSTGVSISDSSL